MIKLEEAKLELELSLREAIKEIRMDYPCLEDEDIRDVLLDVVPENIRRKNIENY